MRYLVLSLFVVAAALFFASSASAQALGLIQDDYEKYAQLFKAGKDPNLSHSNEGSARWRALYRNHHWKDYAEETEFRDSLLSAQILTGIYLTHFVDHELTYQINSIVLHKAHFSNALAEYITLHRLDKYLNTLDTGQGNTPASRSLGLGGPAGGGPPGGGPLDGGSTGGGPGGTGGGDDYYSDAEIERMERTGRNIHEAARKRMVSGRQISRRQLVEIRSIENLFHREDKSWPATYASMREKFLVLNDLADSFTFNWDETRRAEEVQKLVDSDLVRRMADERTRNLRAAPAMMMGGMGGDPFAGDMGMGGMGMDAGGMPGGGGMDMGMGMGGGMPGGVPGGGLTEADIEKMKEEMPASIAEELMKNRESQHIAFKYIVGVYQSSDYHLLTLRTIRRYLQNGADQGNPIAQYHLALFLRYLGEFIGEVDTDNEVQELLDTAGQSDIAQKQVGALALYFAMEAENADRIEENKIMKTQALIKQEAEKMAMIEEILPIVKEKIGEIDTTSSNRGGGNDNGGGFGGGGNNGGGNRGGGNRGGNNNN